MIATLLGDGDGGFREHARRTLVPHGHLKLAAGDLDEDGIVDVAAAAHDSYEVRLFLGDGGGGLRDAGLVEARSGSRPHTHSVALADVDVDGHLDLLTSNADHGDVSVLLGDGGGRFRPAPGSPFAAGRHPYEGMVVEDVDGDGSPDVVVPDLEGASVHVLLGDGSGGFAPAEGSPYAVAVRPGSVAVGDVDGDRLPDVVATHDDDAVVSMLRGVDSGGPAFAPVAGSPFPLEQRAWDARVVDLDGDGRNELVLGGVHRHVLVRSSDPAAWTARATRRVGAGDRGPGYLAVGDLDGDRLLDVVTGNFSGTVSVLLARR